MYSTGKTDVRFITAVNQATSLQMISTWMEQGVREFYFGYMPDDWVRDYGWEVCTNRRPYPRLPHVTDLKTVRNLIRHVHACGGKIYWASNEHVFAGKLLGRVLDLSIKFVDMGIDGALVADLSLITALKARHSRINIHGSVGLGVFNQKSVAFFEGLGVKRFILPRKMRVKEIVHILEATKDRAIEFEVFLLGEWCFYNDEYCFCPHGYGREEFCHSKICSNEGGVLQHDILAEPYAYSWCGLCLPVVLKEYFPRLVFKVPVRSDIFHADVVLGNVLAAYKTAKPARKKVMSMMKCQGRYCAYDFSE